jgi:hypothetical protein
MVPVDAVSSMLPEIHHIGLVKQGDVVRSVWRSQLHRLHH